MNFLGKKKTKKVLLFVLIKDKIKVILFRKMNVSFSVSGEDILLNQLLKKNPTLDN